MVHIMYVNIKHTPDEPRIHTHPCKHHPDLDVERSQHLSTFLEIAISQSVSFFL